MEKEEINPEPGVVNAKPLLSSNKREVVSQFQKEIGEMLNERRFEVRFGIFVLEVKGFEHEGNF